MLKRSTQKLKKPSQNTSNEVIKRSVPCGFSECAECHLLSPPLTISKPAILLDYSFLTEYTQWLLSAEVTNVIIALSSMRLLSSTHPHLYRKITALLEKLGEDNHKLYIFADIFSDKFALKQHSLESDSSFAVRSSHFLWHYYRDHIEAEILYFSCVHQESQELAVLENMFPGSAPLLHPETNATEFTELITEHSILESLIGSQNFFRGRFKSTHFGGEVKSRSREAAVKIPSLAAANRAIHDDDVVIEITDEEKNEGKVVGIWERRVRSLAGSFILPFAPEHPGYPASNSPGSAIFTPVSRLYPKFRVFISNLREHAGKRVVVDFMDWKIDSELPHGSLQQVLGDIGDLDVESRVILVENNVRTYDLNTKLFRDELPDPNNWLDPSEYSRREDFTAMNVCSVDPPGCKDIDDALHYHRIDDKTYEIGVHIADVSYFVKEHSQIDLEAQKRCTTNYLADRRVDMLPTLLTETLCSLVGGQTRFTFSIVFTFDENDNVVSRRYTKGIIHSKKAFEYSEAMDLINDTSDRSELAIGLRQLLRVSRILKQRRLEKGALVLNAPAVKFRLDDKGNPLDVKEYPFVETMSMIEEFMLLGNVAAAEKVLEAYPNQALLRCHPPPKIDMLKDLAEKLKKLNNIELKFASNMELAESLKHIYATCKPELAKNISTAITRCMNLALYTAAGDADEYSHYGLALPTYTHFTSPIRRYSDVIVHRQLAEIIGYEPAPEAEWKTEKIHALTDQMNKRTKAQQDVGRMSDTLHSTLFVKSKGHLVADATILGFSEKFISVFVPRIGMDGRIFLDNIEITENGANVGSKSFKLFDKVKLDAIFDKNAWFDLRVRYELL